MIKEKPEAVPQRLQKMLASLKSMEKEVDQLKTQMASEAAEADEDAVRSINGTSVLVKRIEADNPGALRELADRFKDKLKSGVIVLGSVNGSKVLLIVAVTKDLTDRFHAGKIVKEVAAIVGGGGGGRPDMAQAGGTQPEKLDEALERAIGIIEKY
jgi:alanyl-tRNA synthetase